jgi:hypothetical protein
LSRPEPISAIRIVTATRAASHGRRHEKPERTTASASQTAPNEPA